MQVAPLALCFSWSPSSPKTIAADVPHFGPSTTPTAAAHTHNLVLDLAHDPHPRVGRPTARTVRACGGDRQRTPKVPPLWVLPGSASKDKRSAMTLLFLGKDEPRSPVEQANAPTAAQKEEKGKLAAL